LFEDRVFKQSTLKIGSDCAVGPMSVVLYDSVMGDGSTIDALSLLMKGESISINTNWAGIPVSKC
jgi:carbonic anhydrase/acetyltransferase-like protein (isoleucine patch superfamily)